jgi:transposase, IS6 family
VDETYARIRGCWHYIYRAVDGRGQIVDAYVSPTRDTVSARRFFERAIASSGTTPRRVITDKAGAYPPALAAAVPGVLHRTGRYRTNGIERDHGFLKERLRPMRGLKSVASVATFMRGHALMRNIRRGFYRIVESVPQRLVLAWTWNRLAETV